MNTRQLKAKLKNREISYGSWLQIGDTVVAEIMAKAGFDWLVVDLEHSVINCAQAGQIFQVIEPYGVVPLVRVSSCDAGIIKKMLDAGAKGVIVPNINSADEARLAVEYSKYPPLGKRGTGIFRAQGYGAGFKDYFNTANRDTIVIAQIEHRDAVENIEEILEVDEIDGLMIGPYDISASYGATGNFKNKKVIAAINRVILAAGAARKSLGIHVVFPDSEEVIRRKQAGFNFIACSIDTVILQEFSCRLRSDIVKHNKKGK